MPFIRIPDTWMCEPIDGAMDRVLRVQTQPNELLRVPPMRMHYAEFTEHIEHSIREAVRGCCPTSWDEDHITFSITDCLGGLGHVEVTGLERPFKIIWDARKLRGPTETALGDLGVLVRLISWDGEEIEGIGLLEAKKRSPESSSFAAVRKRQLTRILKHAPRSRLLLYDRTAITESADNLTMASAGHRLHHWCTSHLSREWERIGPYSQAVALPTNLALSVGTFKTSLYKYSLPLSVQLCARYFRGLDLEFDSKVLGRVKSYIERAGGPRYLLLVGVSTGPSSPKLPEGIDTDAYGPLGEPHR